MHIYRDLQNKTVSLACKPCIYHTVDNGSTLESVRNRVVSAVDLSNLPNLRFIALYIILVFYSTVYIIGTVIIDRECFSICFLNYVIIISDVSDIATSEVVFCIESFAVKLFLNIFK